MSTLAKSQSLSPAETSQLARLEGIVAEHVAGFLKVGLALAEIRDKQLFRATHKSFEAYVQDRWKFSRPRAYELIEAAGVTEKLSAMADKVPLPKNERQARALAKSTDPVATMERAAETAPKDECGKPVITARHIAAVVKLEARSSPTSVPTEPAAGTQAISDADLGVLLDEDWDGIEPERRGLVDRFDQYVPPAAAAVDERNRRIEQAARRISAELRELEELAAEPAGRYLPMPRIANELKNALNAIRGAKFHSLCPHCQGNACEHCKETGWITQSVYNNLPHELRNE